MLTAALMFGLLCEGIFNLVLARLAAAKGIFLMSGSGGAIGFTGLKIEEHKVQPGQQVCVLYYRGRRMAVIYPDLPIAEIRVIHEPDIRVRVMKRGQGLAFEEQKS